MASEVSISNLALGHLGDEALVSNLPDGSVQSDHCQHFYPLARDMVLESHDWTINRRRKPLALLTATPPQGWSFAYAYPNNCLVFRGVYLPDDVSVSTPGAIFDESIATLVDQPLPYEIESLDDGSLAIYTNVENAVGHFSAGITDTTKFTPSIVDAIGWLLASYLAGPIIKGTPGTQVAAKLMTYYETVALPRAQARDANVGHNEVYRDFVPSSVSARQ